MITNEDGEKCSAKTLAQEIMIDCLGNVDQWMNSNKHRIEDLTDRELDSLNDQIEKLHRRACRAMGISEDRIGDEA